MPIISSTTTLGSVSGLNSFLFTSDASSSHTPSSFPSLLNYSNFSRHSHKCKKKFYSPFQTPKVSLSGNPKTEQPASASANANADATQLLDDSPESVLRQTRRERKNRTQHARLSHPVLRSGERSGERAIEPHNQSAAKIAPSRDRLRPRSRSTARSRDLATRRSRSTLREIAPSIANPDSSSLIAAVAAPIRRPRSRFDRNMIFFFLGFICVLVFCMILIFGVVGEVVLPECAARSADWKTATAYIDSGFIYKGRIEGSNGGGLLVRFYSLVGFLPFSQLSPSHSCKDPSKTIHEIAKGLTGSDISMKVIQADEENKKLIFSEKEAVWSQFSEQVNVGDIFEARVGSVEDYGAFIHLQFPDGLYHLTGLVHVSEVSWDLVQDVRDILSEGDEVRVKVISVDSHLIKGVHGSGLCSTRDQPNDIEFPVRRPAANRRNPRVKSDWTRKKTRITLSIKQLEEDPLLETLDKVIPQDISAVPDSLSNSNISDIEPLPGLETIFEELLREDGVDDVRISRQGFEKRVVSQDLQLWLSNAPPTNQKFTLLARAGRQASFIVQEIHLTTSLDQEGIKRALQRALERVP
uniref:S1 motif domain-containing protein n=1 Tax=Quercus lobata TaxID=97700 RepID=A0A7N2LZ71_QUELO